MNVTTVHMSEPERAIRRELAARPTLARRQFLERQLVQFQAFEEPQDGNLEVE